MNSCFDLVFLFSSICRGETVAQSTCLEIDFKRRFQRHNSAMLSMGIEPATIRPQTLRSHQLIYAASFLAAPSIIFSTSRP